MGIGGEIPGDSCSRAGCTRAAPGRLEWGNPKMHTGERIKTWLACAEHVDYLSAFLHARSFPVRVVAYDPQQSEKTEPVSMPISGERIKTWLACAEHVDYLSAFLHARSFPVRVVAYDPQQSEKTEPV